MMCTKCKLNIQYLEWWISCLLHLTVKLRWAAIITSHSLAYDTLRLTRLMLSLKSACKQTWSHHMAWPVLPLNFWQQTSIHPCTEAYPHARIFIGVSLGLARRYFQKHDDHWGHSLSSAVLPGRVIETDLKAVNRSVPKEVSRSVLKAVSRSDMKQWAGVVWKWYSSLFYDEAQV